MIWQTIETAPKDRSWILLCIAVYVPSVGLFDKELGWVDFDPSDDFLRKRKWIEEESEYAPTHWMPLPPPPETQATP